MTSGIVKHYNHGLMQGLIKGSDGWEYVLHNKHWHEHTLPTSGDIVEFSPVIENGIRLAFETRKPDISATYTKWVEPDEFLLTEDVDPANTDTFGFGQTITIWGPTHPHDTCSRTPDELKHEMMLEVQRKIGGNAILGLTVESFKRSSGNYIYNEYHVTGYPAVVGVRVPCSTLDEEEQSRRNWLEIGRPIADRIDDYLNAQEINSRRLSYLKWGIVVFLALTFLTNCT